MDEESWKKNDIRKKRHCKEKTKEDGIRNELQKQIITNTI